MERFNMPVIDTIVGFSTAPGAVLVPVAATGAGDTLVVRSFSPPFKAWLLNAWQWANGAAATGAGQVRIRSPRMHDNVNNLQFNTVGITGAFPGSGKFLLPSGTPQLLYSQDTIVLEHAGSAVAGEIESVILWLYYQDIQGASARLIDERTLDTRVVDYMTTSAAIAAGVTGGYSTPTALNTFVGAGNMKANLDYALVGYQVTGTLAANISEIGAVTIRGTDTGNLRIPMPGLSWGEGYHTGNYFVLNSRSYGIPLIPVVNQSNIGGTIVEVVNSDKANTVNVNLIWARLA